MDLCGLARTEALGMGGDYHAVESDGQHAVVGNDLHHLAGQPAPHVGLEVPEADAPGLVDPAGNPEALARLQAERSLAL